MKNLTDETLLDLYFAGDARAFQEFFRRHHGRVVGYASKRGLSREAADEVGQDAFLRLHRSIHTYQRGQPALPWFFTIVHHCLVDSFRENHRLIKLKNGFKADEIVRSTHPVSDCEDRVRLALNSLPSDQRRVVELKVLGDQSFKEISLVLNKSEVGLRKVYERAKKRLKRTLGEADRNDSK